MLISADFFTYFTFNWIQFIEYVQDLHGYLQAKDLERYLLSLPTLLKYQGWQFLGFGPMRKGFYHQVTSWAGSVPLWCHLMGKTCFPWSKTSFPCSTSLDQNLGIANLVILVMLGTVILPLKLGVMSKVSRSYINQQVSPSNDKAWMTHFMDFIQKWTQSITETRVSYDDHAINYEINYPFGSRPID